MSASHTPGTLPLSSMSISGQARCFSSKVSNGEVFKLFGIPLHSDRVGCQVGQVCGGSAKEARDNARLALAAPQLLEALEDNCEALDSFLFAIGCMYDSDFPPEVGKLYQSSHRALREARAALASARGEEVE